MSTPADDTHCPRCNSTDINVKRDSDDGYIYICGSCGNAFDPPEGDVLEGPDDDETVCPSCGSNVTVELSYDAREEVSHRVCGACGTKFNTDDVGFSPEGWTTVESKAKIPDCPCCAGKATGYIDKMPAPETPDYVIECDCCGLQTPRMDNLESALDIWSRRPSDSDGLKCPKCGSVRVKRFGSMVIDEVGMVIKHVCLACKEEWTPAAAGQEGGNAE